MYTGGRGVPTVSGYLPIKTAAERVHGSYGLGDAR